MKADVVDLWNDPWSVAETRPTAHGFDVLLGRPLPVDGPRGVAVIITTPLAVHLEVHRLRPGYSALPVGSNALKRLRRLLGHHRALDRADWWEDRAHDLDAMTLDAFARLHGVSVGAALNARHAIYGPKLRPAGWWREPEIAALILSDLPRATIAADLECSVGAIGRLRWALRQPAG